MEEQLHDMYLVGTSAIIASALVPYAGMLAWHAARATWKAYQERERNSDTMVALASRGIEHILDHVKHG